MIVVGPVTGVLLGAFLFVLLAGASVMFALGLRRRSEADAAVERAERLEAIQAAAPIQMTYVRPGGQIDLPPRVADLLGLDHLPDTLAGLSSNGRGLASDDLDALMRDVTAAQRAGRGFARVAPVQGFDRKILFEGQRAPGSLGAAGGVMLWTTDVTGHHADADDLRARHDDLSSAFDALTGLIEAAPLPMWYRDDALKLGMVNTAYVRAVDGADARDVIARGVELVEGSGRGGPLAGASEARERGERIERLLPATIGGLRRQQRVVDVPLPDGVAGYAIDVEDLEQARAREKLFAEAQRTLLDRLSSGVAQFAADRSLVFCNQPFRRMFAMRSEWLSDRPAFERVLERMREANRLPEVRDFPGWKVERRDWFTRADGTIEENWHLPGGAHIRVVPQPLPDGGLLLIFEDRTEQVQLASARDTLLRVRTATFDNLFEALGVFAADGKLQLWNNRFRALWDVEEEFLSGHPRVETVAEKIAPRLANPSRAKFITALVRAATVERQQRGGRVALADGRHFEYAAVPLPDGNALFTMLDISDARRAEQALRDRADALEAADRVRTAFVANMSYELRTPLTSITGFAEMIEGGYGGAIPTGAKTYVGAILDASERLGVLIDHVLDLTLSDGAAAALEREDLDLAQIARAAAEEMRAAAKRRGIDYAVEVQRSSGRVSGDAKRLREVIQHVLRHAIGAARDGGRVLLHTDGSATRARIIVSDDGNGMTQDEVARAFDRFAEPSLTSGERTFDLGLPLAKQFVEAHGGTIMLVSEPGEGTLVTIELPRR